MNLLNKSYTLDFININVLKECADIFAPLICQLANLSFKEGPFPTESKTAQVTPILKKPNLDVNDPSSYCPISNLNTIGKLLERLFLARILPHTLATGNFNKFQSAYRKHHSTETALLRVLDDLYRIITRKNTVAVLIGLDLSAAFDTVVHSILIDTLQNIFGIRGTVLGWLNSYLNGRTQYIQTGSHRSATTFLTVGVPQGSVLGPFLFSIYTSQISDIISAHGISFHQYADDSQLYTAIESQNNTEGLKKLEDCCISVRDWFQEHGMQLNPDKSEVLIVAVNLYSTGLTIAVK